MAFELHFHWQPVHVHVGLQSQLFPCLVLEFLVLNSHELCRTFGLRHEKTCDSLTGPEKDSEASGARWSRAGVGEIPEIRLLRSG